MSRKVVITKTAEKKLNELIDYLGENWSERIKKEFIKKLDHNLEIIRIYPEIFPKIRCKTWITSRRKHKTNYYILSV
ncbi:MAG: type II toxin-antitoxin system RelE/ParE family toxin [Salegentibacter sp.]|uniref:type II toxin-antitoxin system RelE/ParE family toxin n=1 Tax=Salegentibacter sp. TaxID=1903072 RepID=UPI0028700CCD|nr:type II toxin-antitoxin system RelE/ParE family toxin [Salegentibacter sp.]MDR9456616.1 type II toxin-antitoxin system RelE/ParE family toxin [Salegentibacter sp.]